MKLNKKDIILLDELQKDCRQGLKKLSRKLNMSITTVHERMKKLEREGVIKQYKAVVDPGKAGMDVAAFILVRVQYFQGSDEVSVSLREVAKKIASIPNVMEVHIIAGEWDILVKARGRNITEIGDFVIDRLRKIKGVGRSFTSTVWVTAKESSDLFIKRYIT